MGAMIHRRRPARTGIKISIESVLSPPDDDLDSLELYALHCDNIGKIVAAAIKGDAPMDEMFVKASNAAELYCRLVGADRPTKPRTFVFFMEDEPSHAPDYRVGAVAESDDEESDGEELDGEELDGEESIDSIMARIQELLVGLQGGLLADNLNSRLDRAAAAATARDRRLGTTAYMEMVNEIRALNEELDDVDPNTPLGPALLDRLYGLRQHAQKIVERAQSLVDQGLIIGDPDQAMMFVRAIVDFLDAAIEVAKDRPDSGATDGSPADPPVESVTETTSECETQS